MTNIKNVPHLAIVAASLLVSTYVCSTFFAANLPTYFALPSAVFLSFFAHYYLMFAAKETIKKRRLHQSIVIAGFLTSIVIYCEFNGVHTIAEKATVNTTKLNELNGTLSQYNSELLKVATSRRWQDIEAKRTIRKAIEAIHLQIKKEEKTVNEQTVKAEEKAQSFRFFSVIMLVLSCVASSCINSNSTNVETSVLGGIDGLKKSIDTVLNENEQKPLKTAPIGFKRGIDTGIDTAKKKAYLAKYSDIVFQLEGGVSIREIVQNCNVSKTTVQNVKRCMNN